MKSLSCTLKGRKYLLVEVPMEAENISCEYSVYEESSILTYSIPTRQIPEIIKFRDEQISLCGYLFPHEGRIDFEVPFESVDCVFLRDGTTDCFYEDYLSGSFIYHTPSSSFLSFLLSEAKKKFMMMEIKEPNHLDYKMKNQFNELVFKSNEAHNQYGDDYDVYMKSKDSLMPHRFIVLEVK